MRQKPENINNFFIFSISYYCTICKFESVELNQPYYECFAQI